MTTDTKPQHSPGISQGSDGRLYYGPTPSGKMLDIQSDSVPAGVIPEVVARYNGTDPRTKALVEALKAALDALDDDMHYAEIFAQARSALALAKGTP